MIDLSISQKTVANVFKDLKTNQFIIPAYQRPYKWDEEKCETLWNDIEEFFNSLKEGKKDDYYFLGTIVTFVDGNYNKQVIDGQQRLTSLLLMLRAFYSKLEAMSIKAELDKEVEELKRRINPIIWSEINEITQDVKDFTKLHILSEVATDESKKIFHEILITGKVESHGKNSNLYYKNYKFFQEQCDKFAKANPLNWKDFCMAILNKCVLLPIDCPRQDTALRIFSTLNDRGMPLEDSDIFKAEIYKNFRTPEEQKSFIDDWQDFSAVCEKANMTTDGVFRIYMHILRAKKRIARF